MVFVVRESWNRDEVVDGWSAARRVSVPERRKIYIYMYTCMYVCMYGTHGMRDNLTVTHRMQSETNVTAIQAT